MICYICAEATTETVTGSGTPCCRTCGRTHDLIGEAPKFAFTVPLQRPAPSPTVKINGLSDWARAYEKTMVADLNWERMAPGKYFRVPIVWEQPRPLVVGLAD